MIQQGTCYIPLPFVCALLELVWKQDESFTDTYEVSWLEFVFALRHISEVDLEFPVVCPRTCGRALGEDNPFHEVSMTVAVQLRLVKDALRLAFNQLSLNVCLC